MDLPICDDFGALHPQTSVMMMAHMLFPDEPEHRTDVYLHSILQICEERGIQVVNSDTGFIKRVRAMPTEQAMLDLVRQRFIEGESIGQLYCSVLSLSQCAEVGARASVESILQAIELALIPSEVGRTTLNKRWQKFRRVRYLWAAWVARGCHFMRFEYFEDDSETHTYTEDFDLQMFLREAREALQAGNYQSPTTSRGDPLASTESLTIPPCWKAPERRGPVGVFRIAPPDPHLVEAILKVREEQSHRTGNRVKRKPA